MNFFKPKILDLNKIKKRAKKKNLEFVLLKARTNKPSGDVAGSKLLKFYNHLVKEVSEQFEIKEKGFEYDDKQTAKIFFVAKTKKEVLRQGPMISDKENVKLFKAKHKKTFVKTKRVFAREKVIEDLKKFIQNWKKNNKRKIKEMGVKGLEII